MQRVAFSQLLSDVVSPRRTSAWPAAHPAIQMVSALAPSPQPSPHVRLRFQLSTGHFHLDLLPSFKCSMPEINFISTVPQRTATSEIPISTQSALTFLYKYGRVIVDSVLHFSSCRWTEARGPSYLFCLPSWCYRSQTGWELSSSQPSHPSLSPPNHCVDQISFFFLKGDNLLFF